MSDLQRPQLNSTWSFVRGDNTVEDSTHQFSVYVPVHWMAKIDNTKSFVALSDLDLQSINFNPEGNTVLCLWIEERPKNVDLDQYLSDWAIAQQKQGRFGQASGNENRFKGPTPTKIGKWEGKALSISCEGLLQYSAIPLLHTRILWISQNTVGHPSVERIPEIFNSITIVGQDLDETVEIGML